MANKRLLKKNVNYLFGDLIDECYMWIMFNPDKESKGANDIIDETVEYYDDVMSKIGNRKIEDAKKYFGLLSREVEEKATELAGKINSL